MAHVNTLDTFRRTAHHGGSQVVADFRRRSGDLLPTQAAAFFLCSRLGFAKTLEDSDLPWLIATMDEPRTFGRVLRLSFMVGKLIGSLVSSGQSEPVRAKPIARQARTLAEFWTLHHWPHLQTGRAGTRDEYEYRWRFWLEPELGPLGWDELTRQRIGAWTLALRRQHQQRDPSRPLIASSTIAGIFACLSGMLAHAVALGLLEHNPCEAARMYLAEVTPAPANLHKIRALTLEQARALVTCPTIEARRRAEYAAAIYLCLRVGELHGLRWDDLRLDASPPYARIARSYDGPTKSGRPRDVPIHPELLAILQRWRATSTKIHGREPPPEAIVFPNARGRMQSDHNLSHLATALRRAELPRVTFHGLRHTGATLYRAAGVRREDLAAVLGHASTITDLYAVPSLFLLAGELARFRMFAEHVSPDTSTAHGRAVRKMLDRSRAELYGWGQEIPPMENFPGPERVNGQVFHRMTDDPG